jgi:hypothetical protein
MMRRRRPLLGAAMIGGAAYHAGKAGQQNAQREADQQARLDQLEAQQYAAQAPPPPAYAPPPPPAPAAGGSDLTAKLTELKQLVDQGVLTPDEFALAKQKLLAG